MKPTPAEDLDDFNPVESPFLQGVDNGVAPSDRLSR